MREKGGVRLKAKADEVNLCNQVVVVVLVVYQWRQRQLFVVTCAAQTPATSLFP